MEFVHRNYKRLQETLSYHIARMKRNNKDAVKIFCVGRNKTGTTSLASFFRMNGFKVGSQEQAELLMEDWAARDFGRIIDYCKTAEVFQDVPFSLPDTYAALDLAFPNSKFILTVRSTPEQWYQSLLNHHTKQMSRTSGPPSEEDLRQYVYRKKYKGFILFMQQVVYGYPNVPLYDKRIYMAHYENHNQHVIDYFKNRSDALLTLNLAQASAHEKLCNFVGLNPATAKGIPHENRSDEMKKKT